MAPSSLLPSSFLKLNSQAKFPNDDTDDDGDGDAYVPDDDDDYECSGNDDDVDDDDDDVIGSSDDDNDERCFFFLRFEMLLRTKYACPVCLKSDYTEVQSSCVVCYNCCSCDPSSFASLLRQWCQISSFGLFVKDFVLRSAYEKGEGWGRLANHFSYFKNLLCCGNTALW